MNGPTMGCATNPERILVENESQYERIPIEIIMSETGGIGLYGVRLIRSIMIYMSTLVTFF
jgi:hypothetical protein